MTSVNDVIYSYFFTPVGKGYHYVVPNNIQTAISNFFTNLLFPVRFVNNILQGKFSNSLDETKRFLINTTLGFGGFTDAATLHYNIKSHQEDFGQTLGYWGLGSGPHIVLPILGPSNLRDFVGFGGDYFLNPISYLNTQEEVLEVNGFNKFNQFSKDPEQYNNIKKNAINLYPFLRDSYEQLRNQQIKK